MTTKRRPKGEGSITRMPNGNLKMTLTLGVGADGKQKRRSVTAKTKTELMKRASEVRIQAGLPSQATVAPYFKDVVDVFFTVKEEILAEGTLENYKHAKRLLFEPLYDYRIDKINAEMIDSLIDNIRKHDGSPMNPSTIKNLKNKLTAVMNFAVERGFISVSPMKQTKQRKGIARRVDTLTLPTEEQLKRLLKDAHEYDMKQPIGYLQLYPLFLLAIATGMRIGEILDIDKTKIDKTKNTIYVQTQSTYFGNGKPLKTATSRRIIYVQPDILSEVLHLAGSSTSSTKLWCHKGAHVSYATARQRIRTFFDKCSYLPDGFTFHCFRHYHATQLLLKGINPKEVSKRLGHASIKITLDLYAHWLPEMDERAANSVGTSYIL